MFDNIGNKIKSVASFICVVNIIVDCILGLFLIFSGGVLLGLFLIVIGALISWVNSFLLYGFGELIATTQANNRILEQIMNNLQETKSISSISTESAEPSVVISTESEEMPAHNEVVDVDRSGNTLRCPKCGLIQQSNRTICWNCGARFSDFQESISDAES